MVGVQPSKFFNAFFGSEITAESPVGSHWYTDDPMIPKNLLDPRKVFGVAGGDVRVEVFVHNEVSCLWHRLQSKNAIMLLGNLRYLGWVP